MMRSDNSSSRFASSWLSTPERKRTWKKRVKHYMDDLLLLFSRNHWRWSWQDCIQIEIISRRCFLTFRRLSHCRLFVHILCIVGRELPRFFSSNPSVNGLRRSGGSKPPRRVKNDWIIDQFHNSDRWSISMAGEIIKIPIDWFFSARQFATRENS